MKRNPLLLFLLLGVFLLRKETRNLVVSVLFHEPPRNTRSPNSLHKHLSKLPVYAFFDHPPNKLPISVVFSDIY